MPEAHFEIERKFLINKKRFPYDLADLGRVEIEQGYLFPCSSDLRNVIRLRQEGDKFFMTVKIGRGLLRQEIETPFLEGQFKEWWQLVGKYKILKTRYLIQYEKLFMQLDVFHGDLEGFWMLEVEFRSAGEAARFKPLGWFGEEVTYDERYCNLSLALNGIPD